MKTVLIFMWMGLGSSNVGNTGHVWFDNAAACERAREAFLTIPTNGVDRKGNGWFGYRAAFCTEDKP